MPLEEPRTVLRAAGLRKRFGSVNALYHASITLRAGEVHALLGENGAGKSTLVRILTGAHEPDAGYIEYLGRPFAPHEPRRALRSGIAMVHQELTLAPHLTVAANLLLGREPAGRLGWIDRKQSRARAAEALRRVGREDIDPELPVTSLGPADRQVVEIARAVLDDAKVLILDEPTSSLTRPDARRLEALVRRLCAAGTAVLFISHHLEEVFRVADSFTVLRDGRSVAEGRIAETTADVLVQAMVGREVGELYPRRQARPGKVAIEVERLSGRQAPRGLSLRVREGEILGLAGLVGSGRTETLRAMFGLDPADWELMRFGGKHADGGASERWASGVGMLSEDRATEGLFLRRPIRENLTLPRLLRYSSWGWLRHGEERRAAADWIGRLGVRASGPDQPVGDLSGGNQQKVALARLLHAGSRVLLLDEPTRGIDVGAKAQIYAEMARLADEGCALVMVSSHLPELLGMCDTIAVLNRGALVACRSASAWTEESIVAAAFGEGSTRPPMSLPPSPR